MQLQSNAPSCYPCVNQLLPRLEVAVECSVALQLAPALLLLPATGRTRVQVTEAEEVSSEVGARV